MCLYLNPSNYFVVHFGNVAKHYMITCKRRRGCSHLIQQSSTAPIPPSALQNFQHYLYVVMIPPQCKKLFQILCEGDRGRPLLLLVRILLVHNGLTSKTDHNLEFSHRLDGAQQTRHLYVTDVINTSCQLFANLLAAYEQL